MQTKKLLRRYVETFPQSCGAEACSKRGHVATKRALAWVAVVMCSTATQARAQIDLSHHTLETVIPSEFEGGFLNRVVEIVVADDGIWVNDVGQLKLFQFDHTGRLVVEYGRQGSGPGEFLLPGGLRVDSVCTGPGFLDKVTA